MHYLDEFRLRNYTKCVLGYQREMQQNQIYDLTKANQKDRHQTKPKKYFPENEDSPEEDAPLAEEKRPAIGPVPEEIYNFEEDIQMAL